MAVIFPINQARLRIVMLFSLLAWLHDWTITLSLSFGKAIII